MPVPEPSWTADDAGAAIAEGLSTGFPSPYQVRDLYLELLSHGDPGCPGSPTQLTDDVLLGCIAESGFLYAGIAEYALLPDGSGWYVAGDFSITDDRGDALRVGGGMGVFDLGDEGVEAEMAGSWTWEGGEDWLGQGTSLAVFVNLDPDGRQLRIQGGIGIGEVDLYFDGVQFDPDRCPHPTGEISVRGTDTWWYAWQLPEDCGTCGPVVFSDESLGTLCLDVSTLYDDALLAVVE